LREGSREGLEAAKKVVSNNSPMETKLGINVDDIEIDEEESAEEPQNVASDNSETSEVMQITEESEESEVMQITEESEESEVMQITEENEESEVMQITEEQIQSEGDASVEVTTEAEPEHKAATETPTSSNVVPPVVKPTSDTDLAQEFISASEVSPALVSTFRKMVSYMKAGDSRYTIATLEKFRDSAVKKAADKQWVTQEISKLQ